MRTSYLAIARSCVSKPVILTALLVAVLPAAAHGQTVTLLSEDFESLTLGPFVSPSESGGSGSDWTDVPPAGWVRDNSTTPVGSPVEFLGWTFLNITSWINTSGDQGRTGFISGVGTVMVADPDEYDDMAPPVDPDLFNAYISTPSISLAGVAPGTVTVAFDSSWRAFSTQTATVEVAFDGGPMTEILRWESDPVSPDYKPDAVSEAVVIPVNNPLGANSAVFRFGLTSAGNDWWWATDNVVVQGLALADIPTLGQYGTAILIATLLLAGTVLARRLVLS